MNELEADGVQGGKILELAVRPVGRSCRAARADACVCAARLIRLIHVERRRGNTWETNGVDGEAFVRAVSALHEAEVGNDRPALLVALAELSLADAAR